MKFNEQYTIENHIIKFLKEELGYEYIKPQEFAKLREFENEYIITPLLTAAVKKINGIVDDTEAQAVVREVKKLDSNEAFLNVLRNGVNLKDPETGKMRDYFIVDFNHPENNHFVVTNQFYFEGNSENIRPDVMVFLNGLPIVDIEAKSPTAASSIDYSNAVGQIKRYERNAFKLFWSNCFNIASDGLKTVYGATYAQTQYFLEWREEELEKKYGEGLEVTLAALLSHDRLLDIVGNFILFETEKEGAMKKITRYMQYRGTNKIVERVRQGKTKRGLIWHTQGSGKSFTMFFTAWKLRFDKKLKNPKVFVLVDRVDLDDQLYNTFVNCGGQNVIRVESRRDLERKIQSPERGIFISTIQKFSELGDEVKNLDENIIVLSDEAHRDNEGISAINLRSAMTNAFFFGFTGTPIDRVTLNTHRNFGEEGERYLDYYSIQQSVDDGATLPVTYEARLSKFFIDEEQLDKQFDELTADLTEKDKDIIAKKYGKKEAIVKLDKRMQAIARDIVEHFKLYVEPAGFKAQIVCYDREATAKYKKLLDELIPKNWSEVIYSPGDANIDPEELRKYNTTKAKREKLIDEFKDPASPLKFLLVCDMLLTGFDAPVEQMMYLDKPLWDHNLLQAIARTNRIYPNKGAGKVIDYYGITKSLHRALNFDESIVDSAMINIDKLKEEFVEVLDELKTLFVGINTENPSIENLRRCLKIFADNIEKQKFLQQKYGRLKLLFEILSPDPFLKNHVRIFEWLTSVFIAFEKEYGMKESDAELLAKYGEKVKQLIQQKVDYEGITKNFRELNVNDLYVMERLNKMDDEEKALNLEKMLKQEISINVDTNPAYKKFSERLVAIRKEFEQNQIDLSERIKRYQTLLEDIRKKGDEAKELGYTLKEYGLFVISEEFVINSDKEAVREFIKEMAGRLEEALDEGWQESSKRDEFLKEAKRIIQELVLKEYKDRIKVNDFHKYLNRLIDIVIKKF
ncbi:MAG: HsdR family type I site-specific deoxyribonuclease [bacterium]|nr:HsdR family type I site-specific deoxyribonuclease [bacterium]